MIYLFWVILVIKLYSILNIYQQSHYQFFHYSKYHLKNFFYDEFFSCAFFIVAIILKNDLVYLVSLLFSLIYILIFKLKFKVKLKFTNRLKRLYLFLFLIIGTISWFIPIDYNLVILLFLSFLITPILFIISKIEELLSKRYIKKAKKKLIDFNNIIIGITGSYGKTSTKHFLNSILEDKYNVITSIKSYNTPLGLAKTINDNYLELAQILILEFGASKTNDIAKLMDFIKPNVAIITEVGEMHLETFKNINNILNEKTKIVEGLNENGIAIVNFENEYLRNYQYKTKATMITYGFTYGDYQAKNINITKDMSFDVYYHDKFLINIETSVSGKHQILNILACIAYARYLGIDNLYIKNKIAFLKNYEHRLTPKFDNEHVIIDDSFNANIKGAISALNFLNGYKGKKILITPGFVELKNDDDIYTEFAESILKNCQIVILVGYLQTRKLYKKLENKVEVYVLANYMDAYKLYLEIKKKEQTVLLIENDLPDLYKVGFKC